MAQINSVEAVSGRLNYSYTRSYLFKNACHELPLDLIPFPIQTDFANHCVPDSIYDFGNGEFGIRVPTGHYRNGGLAAAHFCICPIIRVSPGPSPEEMRSFRAPRPRMAVRADAFRRSFPTSWRPQRRAISSLAHPTSAASGSGVDRMGPDIVPYSDVQLERAFRSRYVLGLQFWNENTHVQSKAASKSFPMLHRQGHVYRPPPGEPNPDPNHVVVSFNWTWETADNVGESVSLGDGGRLWDRVLRWGITPSRTAGIPWLAPGAPHNFPWPVAPMDTAISTTGGRALSGMGERQRHRNRKTAKFDLCGTRAVGGPNAVGQNQVIDHLGRDSSESPTGRLCAWPSMSTEMESSMMQMSRWEATLLQVQTRYRFLLSGNRHRNPVNSTGSTSMWVSKLDRTRGSSTRLNSVPRAQSTAFSSAHARRLRSRSQWQPPIHRSSGLSNVGMQRIDLRPSDYKLFDIKCTTIDGTIEKFLHAPCARRSIFNTHVAFTQERLP